MKRANKKAFIFFFFHDNPYLTCLVLSRLALSLYTSLLLAVHVRSSGEKVENHMA